MNKKKIAIVAGGAGFIGSSLCEYLIEKNFKVICIDNLVTGSLKNIKHLNNRDFIFLNHDITKDIMIKGKINYIFHFASIASPKDFYKLPLETLKVNIYGTYNLVDLAIEKKAKFILASSSEVYGISNSCPQREEQGGSINPVGDRAVYSESKRIAETITMTYHFEKKLNICIARIFNTYGPRLRKNDGRVIPEFIGRMLNDENIKIFGDGRQTRSFCYISDTVRGILKLIESNYIYPINIGNNKEISILYLFKKLKKILDSKSKIIYCSPREGETKRRKPDITKANSILDWKPNIELDYGLNETIQYFKKN